MSQFKIHRPYTYLGEKADRSCQLAVAVPLFEGEVMTTTFSRVNDLFQVICRINSERRTGDRVLLQRTDPEIINIAAADAVLCKEVEVQIVLDAGLLHRDYCNLAFANADTEDPNHTLTGQDLLPLQVLQQVEWANSGNGQKNKFHPGTAWVGTDLLEVAPNGSGGGVEVCLLNGKKRKPRVPTNPCPPPQGQFTGNGNNGGGDNHDHKIENLAERIVEEQEPLFESVEPRV